MPLLGHAWPMPTLILMAIAAMAAGGLWIGLCGFLRYARGVNETISSLLLTYIGIAIMNFFVEGPLARSLQPEQAVNQAADLGLHDRRDAGHLGALGLPVRHRALRRRFGC